MQAILVWAWRSKKALGTKLTSSSVSITAPGNIAATSPSLLGLAANMAAQSWALCCFHFAGFFPFLAASVLLLLSLDVNLHVPIQNLEKLKQALCPMNSVSSHTQEGQRVSGLNYLWTQQLAGLELFSWMLEAMWAKMTWQIPVVWCWSCCFYNLWKGELRLVATVLWRRCCRFWKRSWVCSCLLCCKCHPFCFEDLGTHEAWLRINVQHL